MKNKIKKAIISLSDKSEISNKDFIIFILTYILVGSVRCVLETGVALQS